MIVILMGVSGCGKTRIGQMLAERTGLPFYDGDDFHPPANVRKMSSGKPLSDEDRRPWLQTLAAHISKWEQSGGAILACSALKKSYRELLTEKTSAPVTFVHLKGPQELIARRLSQREGHFMPAALLDSQFGDLEEPDDALTVSIERTPEQIVRLILNHLGAGGE